jgi:hypothetical protein
MLAGGLIAPVAIGGAVIVVAYRSAADGVVWTQAWWLASALAAGDLLRGGVSGRLALLDGLYQSAALALEDGRPVEQWSVLIERAAAAHRLAQRVGLLTQDADVVHGQSVGTPGTTSDLKPQLGSAVRRV